MVCTTKAVSGALSHVYMGAKEAQTSFQAGGDLHPIPLPTPREERDAACTVGQRCARQRSYVPRARPAGAEPVSELEAVCHIRYLSPSGHRVKSSSFH